VTAGTAVRETVALFGKIARVNIQALFVSVDRMERGTGSLATLDELRRELGIAVYPIVTVREIIDFLHNRPVDGKVLIDDAVRERMEAYLAEYGALR
jgi:orotate phosphoribosyltransferase